MASSSIQWTDSAWNPVSGCSMVSEGCRFCYAVGMTKRLAAMGLPKYQGLVNEGKNHFNGVVKCHEDVLMLPLSWRKPCRVFVNSMSDLFHESVPDEFVHRVLMVTSLCPEHTFQILTKRPKRMYDLLNDALCRARIGAALGSLDLREPHYPRVERIAAIDSDYPGVIPMWPLPNVHLCVSVEDQHAANQRIHHLLQTPAAVRGLSCEPLIGEVKLRSIWTFAYPQSEFLDCLTGEVFDVFSEPGPGSPPPIDWVIVGGESGKNARPCDLAWIRRIVADCKAASVPVFVKQLGSNPVENGERLKLMDYKGGDMAEWPEDLQVREWPK